MFDKSQKLYTTADELSEAFGIAKSTAGNKAKGIRTQLKMSMFDHKWTLPSRLGKSSLTWMISVNGLIMDVRNCPREI